MKRLRDALITLHRDYGEQFYAERRRFVAHLSDTLGKELEEHRAMVSVLGVLVENGLPARLQSPSDSMPGSAQLDQEVDRLVRHHGIAVEIATAAIHCWAAVFSSGATACGGKGLESRASLGSAGGGLFARLKEEAGLRSSRVAEKAVARQVALAAWKREFETLYGEYRALVEHADYEHLTDAERQEAWEHLCREARLAEAAGQRGDLEWSATGPVIVRGVKFSRVSRTSPYINSLGMRFVPVAETDVLFSVWETRVQDYAAFAAAKSGVDSSWKNPVYEKVPVTPGPTHPVVCVNWDDAVAFAKWLTEKERAEGRLSAVQSYRLPADWEWSVAVGLNEPHDETPDEKSGRIPNVYPWGTQWPPPLGAGNFADTTAQAKFWNGSIIQGYTDGYATTSPVGSFAANQFGLFDLAGNVWEWCEDRFGDHQQYRVLRGGSWSLDDADSLLSSYRNANTPDARRVSYGFRCVLVGGGSRKAA